MWVSVKELIDVGISEATIYRKIKSGEWEARKALNVVGRRGNPGKEILLTSLPPELQLHWLKLDDQPVDESDDDQPKPIDNFAALNHALMRFPSEERDVWIAELNRLSNLIDRFAAINPKRKANPGSGKLEFVNEVTTLCAEAACTNKTILSREPSRAVAPSPHTLERWLRDYRQKGLLTFLRAKPATSSPDDGRKAEISIEAAAWINKTWKSHRHARDLYRAAVKKAEKEGWVIPSEKWFYRRWKAIPQIVSTKLFEGDKMYISKYAPYIPRTAADLGALQLLCGDHRQCDVAVLWRDGRTLIRPWVTLWQDVRTGLIWGWHLDVTPSSKTIGQAYAAGIIQFGAQPPRREGYESVVYTDNGRDYRSRNLDGSITPHYKAAALDGSIELIRRQQQVGLYNEMQVRKMLARGYNAKEKPVERTNRDIADWEENFFDEWCGRSIATKPDLFKELYNQHQKFLKGKRQDSPFMPFDRYLESLAGWIQDYNTTEHTRSVLDNARIVPLEEFNRLYTTRFDISHESLTLLLMKSEERTIGKIGVGIKDGFPTWRYFHSAMSKFKGKTVEVRYDTDDLSRVWVILPDSTICEAELVGKSGYLTPNKQTAQLIKETQARENKLIRNWQLLNESIMRGESTVDRVAAEYEVDEVEEVIAAEAGGGGSVRKITRMDKPKLRAVPHSRTISADQVSNTSVDQTIFNPNTGSTGQVADFDYEVEDL